MQTMCVPPCWHVASISHERIEEHMAVATITIRQLLQRITDGEIRIPAFQREFVWEPDRVQYLMDSIFKGYPIGTVLFWRTKEKLSYDRDLGPFTLPEPKKEYPIDYVLDGQQRLTSIFSTFTLTFQLLPARRTHSLLPLSLPT